MRIYSALVDDKEKYVRQAVYLIWSLTELASVSKDNIVLHYTGTKVNPELEKLGVEIVPVERFEGHRFCNKLNQFKPLSKRNFDELILCDCDLAILEEPPISNCVMAKPVIYSRPPLDLLLRIYNELKLPYQIVDADIEGKTLRGNVNGGVYTMDKKSFDNIHEAWYNWALWCIERRQSFGNHYMFIDQVAFSMALASEKMEYKELDRRFNFSINPRIRKEMDCHPSIIHYNNFYDENFNLNNLPSEFEKCNETIGFLNEQWNYGMEKLS